MKTKNWLKRKYPHIDRLLMEVFGEENIVDHLKNENYKPAILIKDFANYKKGTLFLVKKSGHMIYKHVWDGTYDLSGLFYCGKKITASGYHHTTVYAEDYILLDGELEVKD